MKASSIPFLLAGAALLAACTHKAVISGDIAGAKDSEIIVKVLDKNVFNAIDTLKAQEKDQVRSISYKLDVRKGDPEFVYLFQGERQLAGFLVQSGDKIKFEADEAGNVKFEGSEESARLYEADKAYRDFYKKALELQKNDRELYRNYIEFYRGCVKFVIQNPASLSNIPVLFRNLEGFPIFSQINDALYFRSVTDTLKKIYPESRYVKALENETLRREKEFQMNARIHSADLSGYPDIKFPDINGKKVSLREVDAKVKLLYFWTSTDAAQKMFNLEKIQKLYEEFHSKGLEIYAVCIDPDKSNWATVVKNQKLPWINVNDGLGIESNVLSLYNVSSIPRIYIIKEEEIVSADITGDDALRAELRKMLK